LEKVLLIANFQKVQRLLLRDLRERYLRDALACFVNFLPLRPTGPNTPFFGKILTPNPKLFDALAESDLERKTILPSDFRERALFFTPPLGSSVPDLTLGAGASL